MRETDRPDDVPELMRTSRERWKSVRGTLRHWEDTVLAREATRLLVPQAPPVVEDRASRFAVATRRVWASKPYRWRIEFEGPEGANVFVGDLAWPEPPRPAPNALSRRRTPDALALEAMDGTVACTFDPRIVIDELFVTRVLGRAEHAGRAAVRILAMDAHGPNSLLGWGADDYELLVDAERGVLLRSAARTGGKEFQVTEVLEVAFDEEISEDIFVADDVFQAEPPPGT